MPQLIDQKIFSAGLDRTDGRPALSDIGCGHVKRPFAPNGSALRRPARCAPDELLATGTGQ